MFDFQGSNANSGYQIFYICFHWHKLSNEIQAKHDLYLVETRNLSQIKFHTFKN